MKGFPHTLAVDYGIQALLTLSYVSIPLLGVGIFFFSYVLCIAIAIQLVLLLSFCFWIGHFNIGLVLVVFVAGLLRSVYFFFEFKFNDLLLTGRGYFMIFVASFCISYNTIGIIYAYKLLRDFRSASKGKADELLKVESAYSAPSINSWTQL